MWNAIGHISTGIALAAFLAAVGLSAYGFNLRGRARLIQSLPPKERGGVLTKELNAFGVKAEGLTKAQQYNLALAELKLRSRKLTLVTTIILTIAFMSGLVSAISILFPSRHVEDLPTAQTPSAIPFKCNLNPGFACHYAVYRSNGQVRRFSVLSGEIVDVSGISPDDQYCVSTEDPPADPKMCTNSDKPWRWPTRRVGYGDNFN